MSPVMDAGFLEPVERRVLGEATPYASLLVVRCTLCNRLISAISKPTADQVNQCVQFCVWQLLKGAQEGEACILREMGDSEPTQGGGGETPGV